MKNDMNECLNAHKLIRDINTLGWWQNKQMFEATTCFIIFRYLECASVHKEQKDIVRMVKASNFKLCTGRSFTITCLYFMLWV